MAQNKTPKELTTDKISSYNAKLSELKNILGQIDLLYNVPTNKDTVEKSISLMGQLSNLDLPLEVKIAEIGKCPNAVIEGLKKTWEISKSGKSYSNVAPHIALAQYYIDSGMVDSLTTIPEIKIALQSEEGMRKRYIHPHYQRMNKHEQMYHDLLKRPCKTESEALKITHEMDQQASGNRQSFINIAKELYILSQDKHLTPSEKQVLNKTSQEIINRTAIENEKTKKEIAKIKKQLKRIPGCQRIVLMGYLKNLQADLMLGNQILEHGLSAGIKPQPKEVKIGTIKNKLGYVSSKDVQLRNNVIGILDKYSTSRVDDSNNRQPSAQEMTQRIGR